jgi:hypothetical protein
MITALIFLDPEVTEGALFEFVSGGEVFELLI